MARQSRAFETELSLSAKALGLLYTKIPSVGRIGAFMGETPYDAFLIDGGTHVAIEAKSQTTWGTFPLSKRLLRQVDAMIAVVREGGRAHLLLNFRREPGGKLHNRAFAFNMGRWDELLYRLGTRKSIPTTEILDTTLFTPLYRGQVASHLDGSPTLVWDLSPLVPVTIADRDGLLSHLEDQLARAR